MCSLYLSLMDRMGVKSTFRRRGNPISRFLRGVRFWVHFLAEQVNGAVTGTTSGTSRRSCRCEATALQGSSIAMGALQARARVDLALHCGPKKSASTPRYHLSILDQGRL